MRSRLQIAVAAAWRVLLACMLFGAAGPGHAYHYPWDQGHDTTTTVDPPKPGPEDRSCADPDITCSATRSPVYAASGQAIWRAMDVQLFGRPFMGIYRVYNSNDPVVGLFGNGWAVDFDVALYPALAGGTAERIFKAANGKRFVYVRQANGSFRTPEGRFDTVSESGNTATMTLQDGQRMVFAPDGRLLQRIDANGNAVSFGYDAALRLSTIGDGAGRTLGLSYNAQGLISAVVDQGGRTWRYAYDAQGNLSAVTDPLAGVTRYTWQAYKPAGDAQTYQQLLSATDPSGVSQVSFTYSGNQVTSYTEGSNRISYSRGFSNTASSGTVTQTDSMGVTTSFDYEAQGLVTRDTNGIGGVTRYAYDANGRLTQLTDALGRAWVNTYDALGRLTSSANPLGQTSTLQYSGSQPMPVRMTSPSGRVTAMTYDARGNPLTVTDAAGAVLQMTYNARGDEVAARNALSQTFATEPSAIGLPLRMTDALGRQSSFTYDNLGRLVAAVTTGGEAWAYRYDALDRTTAIIDPLGQTTAMTYDAAGRLLSVTDATGAVNRYEYDSHGRKSAIVTPDGRRTTFAYRNDNLLSQVNLPDGSRINYEHDANKRVTRETAGSEQTTYTYNAVGRLLSATGPGGTVAYTYDAADRVLTETSQGRTSTITRNADGERERIDYLGQTVSYTRDLRGLITRIASAAGNFDIAYDALRRRTQLTYPNGSTARATYDAVGQLTGLVHAGVFTAQYGYTFDAAGRLTRTSGDGADWNYSYDSLGRLTRATQGASSTAYTMDGVGNLLGGGRTHDAGHRITGDSAKTYTHDARGNLTLETERVGGARVAYAWNAKNQLLRVDFFANAGATVPTRTLQFSYDPLGRRASKTDAGVVQRYVYDGDDLVGVLDGSHNIVAVNVFSGAIDEPLASTSGGTQRLLYSNHLGSIAAVSSGAAVTHSYRYGPYGETLAGSSADSVPFRYTGREKDTDSLYFYRARSYSTALQRFISADPAGLGGGLNPYAYVDGYPTGQNDPSGEFGPVGAAGGAGFDYVVQVWSNWDSSKALTDNLTNVNKTQIAAAAAVGWFVPKALGEGGKVVGNGGLAILSWGRARALVYANRALNSGAAIQVAVTCQYIRKEVIGSPQVQGVVQATSNKLSELGQWLSSFLPAPSPHPPPKVDWERRGSLGPGHRY